MSADIRSTEVTSKSKSFKLGRDSNSGKFIPAERARHRPDAQVEHIPKRGYGDTGRGRKK